jgi:hypothetical protein
MQFTKFKEINILHIAAIFLLAAIVSGCKKWTLINQPDCHECTNIIRSSKIICGSK